MITGPDCSERNKLRVYMNGGLIGKIYAGDNPRGTHRLISDGYCEWYRKACPGDDKLREILDEAKGLNGDRGKLLDKMTGNEYIEACRIAVEKRFGNKEGYGQSAEGGEKERHLQTRLVRHIRL